MDSAWTAVAAADELEDGQMKALQLDGRRLLLVRAAGRHYLIDEMCSHEDYSLALGCIKGTRIKCSLHGSWFDLDSGEPLDEPADTPIRTYPARIEDGRIWTRLD
jgi:3-phenylpropionate/trans-cinnamate dioxygenase ferredoxin subunit